jgi:hypothetical protein
MRRWRVRPTANFTPRLADRINADKIDELSDIESQQWLRIRGKDSQNRIQQ